MSYLAPISANCMAVTIEMYIHDIHVVYLHISMAVTTYVVGLTWFHGKIPGNY